MDKKGSVNQKLNMDKKGLGNVKLKMHKKGYEIWTKKGQAI